MTCEFCAFGHPRISGEHVRTDGSEALEPCTALDAESPGPPTFPFLERLAAWKSRVTASRSPAPLRDAPLPPKAHNETEDDTDEP